MFCPSYISKHLFYPLWDIWDSSVKLKEFARLNQSQWLPRQSIDALQWDKFKTMLDYAYGHSRYYRELLDQHGLRPDDIRSRDDLGRIPITRKIDVRNNRDAFISSEYDRATLVQAKTGGSTGFSLDLYFSKQCQELRNAAAMRSDVWAGWDLGKVRGDLWGNPPQAVTFKEKVRLALLDRVYYLDTMQLNQQSMSAFFRQCEQHGVKVIFGHAHSIFIYAQFLEAQGMVSPPLDGIIATSMMLLAHERKVIERVFRCKVTNRYGCEEVGLISCECEQHGAMHINAEHVLVEFVRADGSRAAEGEPAKIVVTDLNNFAMPLLRYQIEDMGAYSAAACACGRGLPLMSEVSGRVADFLKTASGDAVAGISLIERTLTKVAGVEQMQLVQDRIDELVVNRVKGKDYTPAADQALIDELQIVFGTQTSIVINDVATIPQLSNGKYRFSICNI